MIEISFWKILVVLLVALIVLGPDHLPKAARLLGGLIGQFRREMRRIQKDIEKISLPSDNDKPGS